MYHSWLMMTAQVIGAVALANLYLQLVNLQALKLWPRGCGRIFSKIMRFARENRLYELNP